jgi:hypothetical protein
MKQSDDPANQFQRAAEQARRKALDEENERRRLEKERQDKLAHERKQTIARNVGFRQRLARFHLDVVHPLLRSFAEVQKLSFTGPVTDVVPKADDECAVLTNVGANTVVRMLKGKDQAIELHVGTSVAKGLLRGEKVQVTVSARQDQGGNAVQKLWSQYVSGAGKLFDKGTDLTLPDFDQQTQNGKLEAWLREQLTALSYVCAQLLARGS